MTLTEERVAELRRLRVRVQALRRRLPSDGLVFLCDFLEEVAGYLVSVDDEIDELDSRIGYLEHLMEEKRG